MSEKFEPINPDDIKTDDYGRVLDTELRVYQIINNKHIEKIPIRVDGEDVLLLEGDWRHVCQLYRKVEKQEPRKPLEGWSIVHKTKGLSTGYNFEIDESREEVQAAYDDNDLADMRVCHFREVTPPIVKELPDCEALWGKLHCTSPPIRVIDNGEVLEFAQMEWVGRQPVSKLTRGNWINVTKIIEQACVGIKIEKPDFGGGE